MTTIVGNKLFSDKTHNEIMIGSPFKPIIFERIRAQRLLQQILREKNSPRRKSSPGKICTTVSKLFPKKIQDPYLEGVKDNPHLRVSGETHKTGLDKAWQHFRIVKNKNTFHVRKNIEKVGGVTNKPTKVQVQREQSQVVEGEQTQRPKFQIKLKRTLSTGDLAMIEDAPEPEKVYTQEMFESPGQIIPFGSPSATALTAPYPPVLHQKARSLCGLEAIMEDIRPQGGLGLLPWEGTKNRMPNSRGRLKNPLTQMFKVVDVASPNLANQRPKLSNSNSEITEVNLAMERRQLLRETHKLARL